MILSTAAIPLALLVQDSALKKDDGALIDKAPYGQAPGFQAMHLVLILTGNLATKTASVAVLLLLFFPLFLFLTLLLP